MERRPWTGKKFVKHGIMDYFFNVEGKRNRVLVDM
jgi:hypothetical protein